MLWRSPKITGHQPLSAFGFFWQRGSTTLPTAICIMFIVRIITIQGHPDELTLFFFFFLQYVLHNSTHIIYNTQDYITKQCAKWAKTGFAKLIHPIKSNPAKDHVTAIGLYKFTDIWLATVILCLKLLHQELFCFLSFLNKEWWGWKRFRFLCWGLM